MAYGWTGVSKRIAEEYTDLIQISPVLLILCVCACTRRGRDTERWMDGRTDGGRKGRGREQ